MMSLFLNELYGFQLDNHRWYPLELRKEKSTKDKLKKTSEQKPNYSDIDNNVNTNEMEDVATNDKDGDLDYYEDVDNTESNVSQISQDMKSNLSMVDSASAAKVDGKNGAFKLKGALSDSATLEVVKPCGRINSCMVVGRDTLYVYGGMMEIKDKEITLDDLYSLNLSKLDEWKCIIPASESEWVEASDDEDDDDEDEDGSEEEGSSDASGDETDEDDEAEADEVGDALALIKGEKKNLRRKEKRARIEQIRASLGLSDSQRTPMPGESLKDFYKRTNMYWQMAAHEHTQHTGKELRKDGFDLAETRYRELKPILDELAILEAEQKAEEAEEAESSSRKRGKKKTR